MTIVDSMGKFATIRGFPGDMPVLITILGIVLGTTLPRNCKFRIGCLRIPFLKWGLESHMRIHPIYSEIEGKKVFAGVLSIDYRCECWRVER
jgi:hypothetical protein